MIRSGYWIIVFQEIPGVSPRCRILLASDVCSPDFADDGISQITLAYKGTGKRKKTCQYCLHTQMHYFMVYNAVSKC